jgi:uncharacterized membrane protein
MLSPAQLLPSGFEIPPLSYLVPLLLAVVAVGALLYWVNAPVTPRIIGALGPWMVVGASLYALFQVGAIPASVAPLFGSPTVYFTTFVVAGLVWAAVARFPTGTWSFPSAPAILLLAGAMTAGSVVGVALSFGRAHGTLSLYWPMIGVALSLLISATVWVGLRTYVREIRITGPAGLLVIIGHTLDGVSTAIGTDVLGFGEQTPLSRAIIEFGATLPTEQFLGAAWLFVLVKVALAALIVFTLAEYVDTDPRRAQLLLALIAAVGLGPGAHNLVLFAIA